MTLTHQSMTGETFLPDQIGTQIAMAYIRISSIAEYTVGIRKEYTNIVKHCSLFNKLQVKIQFGMFPCHFQCLVSYRTAVFQKDFLKFVIFRIIFVY